MSVTTQQAMNESNGEIHPASDTTASNTIEIAETTLKITPNGLNKLWSLTGSMEIPLDHVAGATVDPGFIRSERKAIRTPGLSVPAKKSAHSSFPTVTLNSGTLPNPSSLSSSNFVTRNSTGSCWGWRIHGKPQMPSMRQSEAQKNPRPPVAISPRVNAGPRHQNILDAAAIKISVHAPPHSLGALDCCWWQRKLQSCTCNLYQVTFKKIEQRREPHRFQRFRRDDRI